MRILWLAVTLGAATLSALVMAPQLYRCLRTRSTRDISFPMLWALLAGCVLWIMHGLARRDAALVVANIALLFMTSALAVVKLVLDFHTEPPARKAGSARARRDREVVTSVPE